jgi:hypothetical protein
MKIKVFKHPGNNRGGSDSNFCLFLCLFTTLCFTAAAQAVVIDDFSDASVVEYTKSVVLEQDAANSVAFDCLSGAIEVSKGTGNNAEQVLFLRNDYRLEAGQILRIDKNAVQTSVYADFGIALSATVDPVDAVWISGTADARRDYIAVYIKGQYGTIGCIGFDGTTNAGGNAGVTPSPSFAGVTGLFIHRTATNVYDVGYSTAAGDTVIKTYTMTNTAIGNAIGFYADVRASTTYGYLDNLQIITDSILSITPAGHPMDVTVLEGHDAVFETVFVSSETPAAEWYHFVENTWTAVLPESGQVESTVVYDDTEGVYRATLRLLNADQNEGGLYYCFIENAGGASVQSETALLSFKQMLARWTLNDTDYQLDAHIDTVGGLPLRPAAMPVFVTGAAGLSNTAIHIGSGDAATSAPLSSVFENGFAISLWSRAAESGELLVTDGSTLFDGSLLEADLWTHLCFVFDGQTASYYRDGQLAGEQVWPLSTTYEMILELGHAFGLTPLNGSVDDVRLYNFSLTGDEVYELYARRTGDAGCVLDYAYLFDVSGPEGWPDCRINLYDFAVRAQQWLLINDAPTELAGLTAFAEQWLSSGLDTHGL